MLAPRRRGFFCRPILRGLYAGGLYRSQDGASGHIVTLFNDLGERYASTHLWERHA